MSDAGIQLLEAVRNGDSESCDPSVLDELIRKRFLFASQDEEESVFLAVCSSSWSHFRLNVPYHYTFIVNTHCNFDCPYCLISDSNGYLNQEQSMQRFASSIAMQQSSAGVPPDFGSLGANPPPALDPFLIIVEQNIGKALWRNSCLVTISCNREHIRLIQVTLTVPRST
jgi:hypothetical protein